MRILQRRLATFKNENELTTMNEFISDTVAAFSDKAYASMYNDDDPVTINVAATGTPYKVTNFSAGDLLEGFTFADDELTCNSPGRYLAILSMSMYGAQGRDIEGFVAINDTGVESTASHSDMPQANNRTSTSGQGLISLDRSDTIQLYIMSHDTTGNITIEHANVTLLKIDI